MQPERRIDIDWCRKTIPFFAEMQDTKKASLEGKAYKQSNPVPKFNPFPIDVQPRRDN